MRQRLSPSPTRAERAASRFKLPAFPTTTIGSFPQTAEVRNARAAHAKGTLQRRRLRGLSCRTRPPRAVRWQEEIGLDVLVHGEFERNDMVQYFGEQLAGFAFTEPGWVQSYGSRCVRPPILFGDVSRPKPMTVDWWQYAQSLTEEADEGHADRARHHPATGRLCATTSRAAKPAGRSRSPSATR